MDLAGADLEIDAVERQHAGKALADPGHAKQGLGHRAMFFRDHCASDDAGENESARVERW